MVIILWVSVFVAVGFMVVGYADYVKLKRVWRIVLDILTEPVPIRSFDLWQKVRSRGVTIGLPSFHCIMNLMVDAGKVERETRLTRPMDGFEAEYWYKGVQ